MRKSMSMNPQPPSSIQLWIRLSIFASLFLFSGACSSTPSVGEKKLLAQKKFQEAQGTGHVQKDTFKKLKEAILLVPKEPMYRVALGNAYFKTLKLDKAERLYLSAIKVDPEFMGTYRQLGRLYMQKSDWDKAIYYLKRALSTPNVIDPLQLLNWMAYSHLRKGDLDMAEKTWLKALSIHDNEKIRLNLALVYKDAQRLDLARIALLKALELNPKLLAAHFALGEIYYQSNKLAQAKKHFNQVVQLEPLSEPAKASQLMLERMGVKK